MDKLALQKMAVEVRKGIVSSVHSAKAGHPGGSLSAADIFTYLYFEEMNIDPKDPKKEDRDRFVLSKGHTAPGLYSALANRGYFPVEDLLTLRHTGSYLQGHPDMKHIPGVDMSSGSLGQGLSAACGMALAGKMKQQDYRVYALCGDGEIEEGQIWEAAMFAGFRKLDNLCVIVDNNNLQIDDAIKTWMTQAKEFSDKGYTQTCDIWSDECTAQMFKDGKAMCYFGPAWYFNFSMGNAQDADKGCFGDWAICEGPQAHFWGGTWLLAPAGTDNPTMVADIMNTFINNEEVCTNLVKNEAQFSNNQKVNETVAQDPAYGSDFLGGQNDIALFCDLAKNIKFENHTIYDQLLNEGLQANWREYCKGTVTEDEAMSNFYKYINEKYPTIVTP